MSQTRQLAAIMFTDIVGYTTLMQQDEQNALRLLNRFKEVLEKISTEHKGKIVQYYGDGCLLAFDSSSNSVECAIAIQKTFGESPQVPVRIGLHLGDVIFKNENIFGDGVNVASRIESLGVPGAILLSKSIRDQVKNNSEFQLTSLGSFHFKNVEESIEVFAVSNPGLTVPKRETLKGKLKDKNHRKKNIAIILLLLFAIVTSLFLYKNYFTSNESVDTGNLSIAVLPFENLSDDAEQDYFSDGLTEDIIDRLSKINNLKVVSRTSVLNYKKSKLNASAIATELGVKFILEGSVRRLNKEVRVVIQLIDAEKDKHLWSTTFNKAYTDIFQIQSDIAENIAQYLKISLTENEKGKLVNIPTKSIEAYDLFLQARKLASTRRKEKNEMAITLFRQALQFDPEYADALASLALAYWDEGNRWHQGTVWIDSAIFYANKSIEIDPENSLGYYALGFTSNERNGLEKGMPYFLKSSELGYPAANSPIGAYYLFKKDSRPDSAYFYFRKGLQMDPTDPVLCMRLGNLWDELGSFDSAKFYFEKSYFLNPDQLDVKFALSSCFIKFKKYAEGINYIRKNLLAVENTERIVDRSMNDLAKIYAFTSQYDSTISILKKTSFGKESLLMAFALKESGKKAEAKKIVELNRKKINDRPDPLLPVKLFILEGNYDEAVSSFLKADESRFIRVLLDDPIFLKIKDRPEIRSILEKKEARNREMIKAIEDNKIVIE
jgi:TolB-like protein/class 3 adenylate cyclase/Tfp pilus assembly protein PilF